MGAATEMAAITEIVNGKPKLWGHLIKLAIANIMEGPTHQFKL
jgi:hypothetical protein